MLQLRPGAPEEVLLEWIPYLPEKAAFRERLILSRFYRTTVERAMMEAQSAAMRKAQSGPQVEEPSETEGREVAIPESGELASRTIPIEQFDEKTRKAAEEIALFVNKHVSKNWAAVIEIKDHQESGVTTEKKVVWADTKKKGLSRKIAEFLNMGPDGVYRRINNEVKLEDGTHKDPLTHRVGKTKEVSIRIFKRDELRDPKGTPFDPNYAREFLLKSAAKGGRLRTHGKKLSPPARGLAQLELSESQTAPVVSSPSPQRGALFSSPATSRPFSTPRGASRRQRQDVAGITDRVGRRGRPRSGKRG